MISFNVVVTDTDAGASASYAFELQEDAERFQAGMVTLTTERHLYWIEIGSVEKVTIVPAEADLGIDTAIAEWSDYNDGESNRTS